ncbi:IcmH (DotU) [Legionella moravica]|uniref:IcmH (DotU) n=1 Tax=Legionella moravica TaxID=39962 RepID=A0A378JSA6_9GAMM|nr:MULTISPECIES: type IVB secretion system protein IcmH/DotU [Legionella]KTD32670.1 IcmH (DotU) [Legionella moravica]RUR20048.1 DotU family type IV/VI secretion system protein [Legionella sp. km535]STX61494.1 IcmH (DotU) [Legionella moravica]
MTAEHYPASLVSRLAISGPTLVPQGYYRSKLFIAPFSSNSLVAAAGPLLSLLERLCLSPSLPPIENIRENIEHELRAFHSKLDASKYPQDLISIAHYLLSATIDEILGKSYLRIYNQAAEFKSFTPLTSDGAQPQQRFFEILNYIKDRPNQFLDLIELVYFCLIVGFEGEYHLRADGRQMLDNTIEDLYQIIQQYRFNKPHRLFNENPIPKTIKKSYKASMITTIIAVSFVALALLTSHIVLENKAKTLLFGHTQLAMLDD